MFTLPVLGLRIDACAALSSSTSQPRGKPRNQFHPIIGRPAERLGPLAPAVQEPTPVLDAVRIACLKGGHHLVGVARALGAFSIGVRSSCSFRMRIILAEGMQVAVPAIKFPALGTRTAAAVATAKVGGDAIRPKVLISRGMTEGAPCPGTSIFGVFEHLRWIVRPKMLIFTEGAHVMGRGTFGGAEHLRWTIRPKMLILTTSTHPGGGWSGQPPLPVPVSIKTTVVVSTLRHVLGYDPQPVLRAADSGP